MHIAGAGQARSHNRCAFQCALDGSQIACVYAGDAQQQVIVEHRCGACEGVVDIARVGLNGEQCRSHGIGCSLCDQALQLGECVDVAAIGGRSTDFSQHKRQVVRRDARDAQCLKIGHSQGLCRRCASGRVQDGLCARGQSLDLGHGVHTAGGLRTDDGVQQRLSGRAVGKPSGGVGTDGAVISRCGVGRCIGIGCCTIGLGQDAVVGIDQGLNLGRRVNRRIDHTGGRQCTVEGRQVGVADASDACDLVVAQGRQDAA